MNVEPIKKPTAKRTVRVPNDSDVGSKARKPKKGDTIIEKSASIDTDVKSKAPKSKRAHKVVKKSASNDTDVPKPSKQNNITNNNPIINDSVRVILNRINIEEYNLMVGSKHHSKHRDEISTDEMPRRSKRTRKTMTQPKTLTTKNIDSLSETNKKKGIVKPN